MTVETSKIAGNKVVMAVRNCHEFHFTRCERTCNHVSTSLGS